MRSPVWALEEINKLPQFGADYGWFYGLVKHHETGKVRICEIFPGLGYANPWPVYHPKNWWWIIKDIWKATK